MSRPGAAGCGGRCVGLREVVLVYMHTRRSRYRTSPLTNPMAWIGRARSHSGLLCRHQSEQIEGPAHSDVALPLFAPPPDGTVRAHVEPARPSPKRPRAAVFTPWVSARHGERAYREGRSASACETEKSDEGGMRELAADPRRTADGKNVGGRPARVKCTMWRFCSGFYMVFWWLVERGSQREANAPRISRRVLRIWGCAGDKWVR